MHKWVSIFAVVAIAAGTFGFSGFPGNPILAGAAIVLVLLLGFWVFQTLRER